MRTLTYRLLNFLDELLDVAVLGAWRRSKAWPFTSLALLLIACLSLIFMTGPCSTTDELLQNETVKEHIQQVCQLLNKDILNIPFSDKTENELSEILDSDRSEDVVATESITNDSDPEVTGLSQLFYKRPFFDKFPADQHEKYNVYFFTDKSVGAYMEMEYMKQINEFFLFKKVLNRFAYLFPHSKLKGMTRFALESCEGPGTFDLKMTVFNDPKKNKEKRVFYSWKSFKPPASE
jgi:hypothetical protein